MFKRERGLITLDAMKPSIPHMLNEAIYSIMISFVCLNH